MGRSRKKIQGLTAEDLRDAVQEFSRAFFGRSPLGRLATKVVTELAYVKAGGRRQLLPQAKTKHLQRETPVIRLPNGIEYIPPKKGNKP